MLKVKAHTLDHPERYELHIEYTTRDVEASMKKMNLRCLATTGRGNRRAIVIKRKDGRAAEEVHYAAGSTDRTEKKESISDGIVKIQYEK